MSPELMQLKAQHQAALEAYATCHSQLALLAEQRQQIEETAAVELRKLRNLTAALAEEMKKADRETTKEKPVGKVARKMARKKVEPV